jgi:hypothetical protein
VAAFVRSHGSIKEMERLFGVSYPTVKNRLNRLSQALGSALGVEHAPAPERSDVLDRLERGEITRIKAENLEEIVEHLGELTVDVTGDGGEKVRIFCE